MNYDFATRRLEIKFKNKRGSLNYNNGAVYAWISAVLDEVVCTYISMGEFLYVVYVPAKSDIFMLSDVIKRELGKCHYLKGIEFQIKSDEYFSGTV